MKLPVEVLDRIFSFLVSHQATLIACSEDLVLSHIVERHLYCFIAVEFPSSDSFRLSSFIDENPRILPFVRTLRIEICLKYVDQNATEKDLSQFAKTLLMFPVLKRIELQITRTPKRWKLPDDFRAALEDRLHLPTLEEFHIDGTHFPRSLIHNIENLSLSGSLCFYDAEHCVSPVLQLKSLTLLADLFRPPLLAWVKSHIKKLRSLKCALSAVRELPQLLGVCSQTLEELDIDLAYSDFCSESYRSSTGEADTPLPELTPIPPNLQQLTLRAGVLVDDEEEHFCSSYLPAAAKIITSFGSSLQHLILELDIHLSMFSTLAPVDFSPLSALGVASIPRIDLYIHTNKFSAAVILARLLSCLADYDDVMRSIAEGRLVIHSERTAPAYIADDHVPYHF